MLLAASKQQIFITICTWHLLQYCMTGAVARRNQRISRYRTALQRSSSIDIKDKILEWQCLAKCEHLSYAKAQQNCREQCKKELMYAPRHGHCPSADNVIYQNISPLEKLYCLNNCSYDYDCAEVQKCCPSSCGSVCMQTHGLDGDTLLPPIPKILKHKLPHGNWVELTIQTWANSSYFCHVEIRYHYGTVFSERMLSAWQWQPVKKIGEISDTRIKSTDIAFKLKTGRYYQVRVAAVNENGFRGYSEPSQVFTPRNEPKPPREPIDLKVLSANFDGKFYKIKIAWCPSKSNLPIEKYKIIWSLYIETRDGSFISNEAYVKDSHQFELKYLLPDSSYYVQVQAMSINGDRRLKSQKVAILFNTTTTLTTTPSIPLKCAQQMYQKQRYATNNNKNNYNNNNNNNNNYNNNNHNNSVEKYNKLDADLDGNDYNATPTTIATTRIASDLIANMTTTYKARYRFNRKLGMITQISGFQPYKEKVYELCPIETNCEEREYSAIRVKKDSLEFSKLKFNTTYVLKAYKSNGEGYDSKGAYTFTTPKCENFRKSFPKALIKC